mgnify:CR=1 FL=1
MGNLFIKKFPLYFLLKQTTTTKPQQKTKTKTKNHPKSFAFTFGINISKNFFTICKNRLTTRGGDI